MGTRTPRGHPWVHEDTCGYEDTFGHMDMDYDCLSLVLAWVARARVEERCEKLRAFCGAGDDDNQTLDVYPDTHIMDAKGMLYEKEALLFTYNLSSEYCNGFEVVQCKEQLCLYDVEHEFYQAYIGSGPYYLCGPPHPCLSWGKRKNVKFTIALCKSLSVTIIFGVFSVPRSWWVCDYLGYHWTVVQVMKEDEIIATDDALPFTIDVPLSRVTHGCDIVAWITRSDNLKQDCWQSRDRLVM